MCGLVWFRLVWCERGPAKKEVAPARKDDSLAWCWRVLQRLSLTDNSQGRVCDHHCNRSDLCFHCPNTLTPNADIQPFRLHNQTCGDHLPCSPSNAACLLLHLLSTSHCSLIDIFSASAIQPLSRVSVPLEPRSLRETKSTLASPR